VVTDDRRERLERLRDQLTAAVESCSENMLPQLAGQLRATLADLAALPEPAERQSLTDELKQRRAARRAQRPRLSSLPPGQVSSAGQDAVDFAASCGLVLDDWQSWCLDKMLGEDADGRTLATTAPLILPRQNGKNAVLEALELYAFYVLDEPRILHTAHLAKTAADHMQRMVALVRSNPDLDGVTHCYFANGKKALQRTDTGARLKFITRGRKTARGGSPTRVVFDEALFLLDEQVQSILPAMSAQSMRADPPQLIYTSSGPLPESVVLHRLRRQGMSGESPRMFFAEWSVEVGTDPARTGRRGTWRIRGSASGSVSNGSPRPNWRRCRLRVSPWSGSGSSLPMMVCIRTFPAGRRAGQRNRRSTWRRLRWRCRSARMVSGRRSVSLVRAPTVSPTSSWCAVSRAPPGSLRRR